MRTIWKFNFAILSNFVITMPKLEKVLLVGLQGGVPTLWAMVDISTTPTPHEFLIFGTGHRIPPGVEHIASFQQGAFAWHLFRPV